MAFVPNGNINIVAFYFWHRSPLLLTGMIHLLIINFAGVTIQTELLPVNFNSSYSALAAELYTARLFADIIYFALVQFVFYAHNHYHDRSLTGGGQCRKEKDQLSALDE